MSDKIFGQSRDTALIFLVAAVVFTLSLWPMLRLASEIIAPNGQLSDSALHSALSSTSTWVATRNSLITGFGGTFAAVILGSAVALLVSLTNIRGRGVFVLMFVVPLLIAPQVTALAWLQLFGPASPFLKMIGMAPELGSRNPLYSTTGIIALLGIQYAPLVFLIVRAGLRKLPRELVEAALSSGASKWQVTRTIRNTSGAY